MCDARGMGNAIWLLTALPSWYLEGAAHPLSAGALTLIPAIGLFALLLGAVLGVAARRRELLWFLLLFGLSEVLVGLAGLMRGQVRPSASDGLAAILYAFLGLQLSVSVYLLYRIRGARLATAALGIFSVTYAAYAIFIAGMSFTDTWL